MLESIVDLKSKIESGILQIDAAMLHMAFRKLHNRSFSCLAGEDGRFEHL